MRIFAAAAIGALLMGAPAAAQTGTAPAATPVQSACGAIAPAPTLLDGATATRGQMDAFNTTYTAWFSANRDALTCRRTEFEAAQARAQALRDEYNAGAAALNTTNTTWQAEVTEFNARTGTGRPQTTRDIPPTNDAPAMPQ
jgi:hypothetical protein